MNRTLSVAIIAQDEIDRLQPAIESATFADEVLVLDGGSVDGTPRLAASLGATVHVNPWPGYVAQRNEAARLAHGDLIFFLDADERITPELRDSLQELTRDQTPVAGAWVRRQTGYLGQPMRRAGWGRARCLRLMARGFGQWEGGPVHERLVVAGRTVELRGLLVHDTYRNLADHVRRIGTYASLAGGEPGRGGGWLGLTVRPLAFFLKRYFLRLGFLEGRRGLVLCVMGAWYTFLTAALAFERELREDG